MSMLFCMNWNSQENFLYISYEQQLSVNNSEQMKM